jgi:hypothetical protein
VPTTVLNPGYGCWVRARQPGALILRSSPSAVPRRTPGLVSVAERTAGDNRLIFTDAAGHTETLTFGLGADAKSSPEEFELPPVPPEGVFDVRFSTQRSRTIFAPSARRDAAVDLQGFRDPLTVTWRMNPGDHGTWMFVWDSLRIPLRGSGTVCAGNAPRKADLVLVSGAEIPGGYSLEQNYPNPFNPATRIDYALPERTHVTLVVYDVLGHEIVTLVDREEEGGYKTVTFEGKSLPSGVLYTRLTAGNFVAMKKMALVR